MKSARAIDTNRPLIGILSQPVTDDKRDIFDYEEYILGINYEFITLGNSQPVYMSYETETPEQE